MKNRIVIDHRNTNKQLRHYDSDGDYIRLSVDETIARGLNSWKGWTCSAGMKNLYIDYDGNIWICNTASAVADRFNYAEFERQKTELFNRIPESPERWIEFEKFKVAFRKTDISASRIFPKGSSEGLLGNIFDGFELPTRWTTCIWEQCGCGADVFIAKARIDHLSKLEVSHRGHVGQDASKDRLVDKIERPVAVEPNFPIPFQILWDLGRRCNYDCSYCWPAVHNRDAPHKSLEVMQAIADKLISKWAGNGRIRWNFGGGEPTLNPDFLPFLEYLRNHNQWVLVTTNGSRPRSYWKKAIEYINSVNLSVHFEFVDEGKLLGNIAEICNHFDEHNDDHWLEIKLMAPPQFVTRAVALREKIKTDTTLETPGANGRNKGTMSIVPIRGKDGVTLVDYSEEELKLLQSQ